MKQYLTLIQSIFLFYLIAMGIFANVIIAFADAGLAVDLLVLVIVVVVDPLAIYVVYRAVRVLENESV